MNADRYHAAQTLFRAFCYLHGRMTPQHSKTHPNPEFLAGCVLHACLAQLLGEIRQQHAMRKMDSLGSRQFIPETIGSAGLSKR